MMETNDCVRDMTCIEPNLWLGSVSAATNLEFLDQKKIKFVLTVNSFPLPKKNYDHKNLFIKYIEADDIPKEDLLSHFDDAYEFIKVGLEKNVGVLVHCYFGISRSATIIISYIMKVNSWTLDFAYEYIKSKRNCINPNPGFMAQLKLFERMSYKLNKNNMQYKIFRLSVMKKSLKELKKVPDCFANMLKTDPSYLMLNPEAKVFRCKKCRRVIGQESNLILHASKKKFSWKTQIWNDGVEKFEICRESYFVEPLPWMNDVFTSLEGKLLCPNMHCKKKVGSFSWIPGCQCPCGTKVSPGFYLIPSKIDFGFWSKNIQHSVKSQPQQIRGKPTA